MTKKIALAYFAVGLSVLSLAGLWLGTDAWVFVIFSVGCLTYSGLALYLFKEDMLGESSKAFTGGLVALSFVLLVQVWLIAMALYAPDSVIWERRFQFLALFGTVPVVIIGAGIGWIADLFSAKKIDASMPPQPRGRIF